jgi:CLIP-associating protein 1/2
LLFDLTVFRPLPDIAKSDLKKQLQQRNVRKTIVLHIYNQLGLSIPPEIELSLSTHSLDLGPSLHSKAPASNTKILTSSTASEQPAPAQSLSLSEVEAEKLDPLYINSNRELEEIFRDMHPFFEGKETEHNWSQREKSIIKLRRITKGNAPQEFSTTFLTSIKALLDGILKTVNSLRTTVCTNGCHLIQDLARACGSGLDSMVEILLQTLIKLCGGTKAMAAQSGNTTVDSIFANVTYNVRLMQHIWVACQDKNVRPRTYATGWLKTLLTRHGHHKHIIEHANGLDLVDKCIKRGLEDASPAVRESMRPTYWAYWQHWPDRAESIMNSLDATKQGQLLKDPSNPDPNKISPSSTAVSNVKAPPFARSTTSAATRPSLKETIAARKQAKLAERPESAQASVSPTRPILPRPATSMATGSLSAAPLRPARTKAPPAKKAGSPAISPSKTKPRVAPQESFSRLAENERPRSSPAKALTFQNENTLPRKPNVDIVTLEPSVGALPKLDSPLRPFGHNSTNSMEQLQSNPPKRVVLYNDATVLPPPTLVRSAKSFEYTAPQSNPSPTKAAEELTLVLPATSSIGFPGMLGFPQNFKPNAHESGRAILGEIPVNHDGSLNHDVGVKPPSPTKASNSPGARSTSPTSTTSRQSSFASSEHKLIDSGTARIITRTLDAHGFRKLQPLITTRPDLWQDHRYEELFTALLTNLGNPKDDPLRSQVLKTLGLMVTSHPRLAKPLIPNALLVLLALRPYCKSHTHITADLEDVAKTMVDHIDDPIAFMNILIDLLGEASSSNPATIAMSLETLADLMHRSTFGSPQLALDEASQFRLGNNLLLLMNSLDVAIRKNSMECLLELYDMPGGHESLEAVMKRAKQDDKNLFTYFLTLRQRQAT